jgi:hypothetical protein
MCKPHEVLTKKPLSITEKDVDSQAAIASSSVATHSDLSSMEKVQIAVENEDKQDEKSEMKEEGASRKRRRVFAAMTKRDFIEHQKVEDDEFIDAIVGTISSDVMENVNKYGY